MLFRNFQYAGRSCPKLYTKKLNADLPYAETLAWKEIFIEIRNAGAYNDYLEQRE